MTARVQRVGRGLTSPEDAAAILGVDLDDVAYLTHLGLLKRSRGGGFVISDVEALAASLGDVKAKVAAHRHSHGGQRLQPDEFVRQAGPTLAHAVWGQSGWTREVAIPTVDELRTEAAQNGLLSDREPGFQLVPPELRQPLNRISVPDYLIQVAIFARNVGAVWATEKVIEAAIRPVARAVVNAGRRHLQWTRAKGFWFLVSVWYADEGLWGVVALDVSPQQGGDVVQLLRRGHDRILNSRPAHNGPRALLFVSHEVV